MGLAQRRSHYVAFRDILVVKRAVEVRIAKEGRHTERVRTWLQVMILISREGLTELVEGWMHAEG
jgi:hypothetical protein